MSTGLAAALFILGFVVLMIAIYLVLGLIGNRASRRKDTDDDSHST